MARPAAASQLYLCVKLPASSSVNLIAVYGGFWVWSDGHDRPPTFAADVHATEMVHAFLESRGFTAYHSL